MSKEDTRNGGKAKERIPRAKKARGKHNPRPDASKVPEGGPFTKKSLEKVSQFRGDDDGVELTPQGQKALENLMETAELDVTWLQVVKERSKGDRDKILKVLENLSLGARHRDALADVGWTWSNFSCYRSRYPEVANLYKKVRQIGEDFRQILREDEAHRRAYEGFEEPVYSASGKFCGNKIRYSDALLMMFLKADNPNKFMDRSEVKSSGVVLNVSMGLRDNVRETCMEASDIEEAQGSAANVRGAKKEDTPDG